MMALRFVLALAPLAVQSLVYGTQKTPMQLHPFIAYLQQVCRDELSSFVDDGASFYKAVDQLQDFKMRLSNPCHEAVFNASAAAPNKHIFKPVAHRIGVAEAKPNVSERFTLVLGYVSAPLFYGTPEKSPLFKTWFGIVPARKQPAPKGILFIHTGGPDPSIMSGAWGGLNMFEAEHWEHVLENYDIVSVDQRGMGLSSTELFTGFVLPEDPRDLFAVADEVGGYSGQLNGQVKISGQVFDALCYNLSQEEDFFEPEDWANLREVSDFLDEKMRLTVACSKKYDRDDGEGGKYNLLQYMGTQALVHDLEWLRLSLGAPEITLLGYSYGSRVVAAYSAMFPKHIVRTGITGVMGPYADSLRYAKAAALNTGEIFGFIQSQCVASSSCKNPFAEGEANEDGFYFDGDINHAVDELFTRSLDGGAWYTGTCGAPLPLKNLMVYMQSYLTSSGPLPGYQDKTWPWGFAALPSVVFYVAQNPCAVTAAIRGNRTSAWNDVSVFSLVPALDMTGRWSRNQIAAFITAAAQDSTMTPGLNMFLLYATAAHGWPQLPTPIGFDQPQVKTVIAQALYDERTGMNMAQDYKIRFPNSSLISSLSGGHCVGTDRGTAANAFLTRFIIHGDEPRNGMVTGSPLKIDFQAGAEKFKTTILNMTS